MYGVGQVLDGGSEAHGQSSLMDEVAGVGAQDMATEDVSFCIGQYLHQPVIGLHGQCFAVGTVEGLVGLILDASLRELFLRLSHHGGFGNGEDG